MADVVVIGGANIDIKAKVAGHHIIGTSNPGNVSMTSGGVGRNIAHNLARLGCSSALISIIGDDAFGDTLIRQTETAGVDVSMIQRQRFASGTYVALIDGEGEMLNAVSDMRILDLLTPDIIRMNATKIHAAKFVVADCNLPLDTLLAIADLAGHKLAIEPVSVQKSKKLPLVLKQQPVFLATPNLHQIESLIGSRAIDHAARELHAKGLRNVVIHAGSEGAFASDGESLDHVEPGGGADIIDVTGAGDAAMAGLVFGLLRGETLLQAAARGQATAAKVIRSTRSTLE
jgi:pseudouridine kinase